MMMNPCPGKLPLSRAFVVGCALVFAGPALVSVARAEDPPAAPRLGELGRARSEMDTTLARMTSASRHVRDMLRDARKRGTKRQVACLDEVLSRADVAQRSARDQAAEALAAYSRNDLANARSARARVAELDEAQRLAVRDGTGCLPQPVVEAIVPGTFVRLTVDPNIPNLPSDFP